LIEEGLRLVLASPRETSRPLSLAELMEGALGAVDSGVRQQASNPEHLKNFGAMRAAILDTGPLVALSTMSRW
jgi:hypothetical protein